jgi:hypothetical protein
MPKAASSDPDVLLSTIIFAPSPSSSSSMSPSPPTYTSFITSQPSHINDDNHHQILFIFLILLLYALITFPTPTRASLAGALTWIYNESKCLEYLGAGALSATTN